MDQPLLERIRTEIRTQGPISFARFMERALTEPGLGYYVGTQPRAGRDGDFMTAPEMHSLLGSALARLIRETAAAAGQTKVTYQGREIDFAKPYDRLTIAAAIRKYAPDISDEVLNDKARITAMLKSMGVETRVTDGLGALQLALFENTVETKLHDPTFLVDYPAEVSPLARRSDKNPEITERFELFIAGREIANGFSELNDPEDQAARFQEQVKQKDAGDHEAMHYDADYIRALEYGLPPTAGAGIGIDRLVMLLTDAPSIRAVILFPQMRPE